MVVKVDTEHLVDNRHNDSENQVAAECACERGDLIILKECDLYAPDSTVTKHLTDKSANKHNYCEESACYESGLDRGSLAVMIGNLLAITVNYCAYRNGSKVYAKHIGNCGENSLHKHTDKRNEACDYKKISRHLCVIGNDLVCSGNYDGGKEHSEKNCRAHSESRANVGAGGHNEACSKNEKHGGGAL